MSVENDPQLEVDYLQISPNILESFPKENPPVNLFVFEKDLGSLRLMFKAGMHLSSKKQAEVAQFCREGNLYLFRGDYQVYAGHLSHKLGVLLVESNLNGQEVGEAFFLALHDRLAGFFDQPTVGQLQDLRRDLSILAEYIWIDPARTGFLCKTFVKRYDMATHAVNCIFAGIGVYAVYYRKKLKRMTLTHMALGLALHDLGMTMVPELIRDKPGILLHKDMETVKKHPDMTMGMLNRLKIDDQIVEKCVMEHHERLDGSGYPGRLHGEKISVPGRICGLVDSFSAAIAERPYKGPQDILDAAESFCTLETKYDSKLARILFELIRCGFEGCKVNV